jgi:hypothetical protein
MPMLLQALYREKGLGTQKMNSVSHFSSLSKKLSNLIPCIVFFFLSSCARDVIFIVWTWKTPGFTKESTKLQCTGRSINRLGSIEVGLCILPTYLLHAPLLVSCNTLPGWLADVRASKSARVRQRTFYHHSASGLSSLHSPSTNQRLLHPKCCGKKNTPVMMIAHVAVDRKRMGKQ